mmetsp:Transcript_40238/g.79309  ORF Transcript_40238/g.79309 Transcript_40238/m.79309 type:complete len:144 (+) Transcript_40238:1119-1550(+)
MEGSSSRPPNFPVWLTEGHDKGDGREGKRGGKGNGVAEGGNEGGEEKRRERVSVSQFKNKRHQRMDARMTFLVDSTLWMSSPSFLPLHFLCCWAGQMIVLSVDRTAFVFMHSVRSFVPSFVHSLPFPFHPYLVVQECVPFWFV